MSPPNNSQQQANQPPKVQPSGRHLAWTEDDIAELAEITDADIADAMQHARDFYPELADFLDAADDDQ